MVLADRRVEVPDDSLYATFIGSDFVEEGRRAGKWLAEEDGRQGGHRRAAGHRPAPRRRTTARRASTKSSPSTRT